MRADTSNIQSENGLLAQAVHWHQCGELDKAEGSYRNILRRHPNQSDALNLLGLIAYARKNYENAAHLIRQAIGENSQNSDYYNNLGTVLKALGHMSEARDAYLAALKLNPQCANSNYNMGGLCLVTGAADQAIYYYRKTISFKSDYLPAYTNLSAIYNGRKAYDQALECCRRGIESGGGDAALYNNLGNALKGVGRFEQAAVMFEKALQLDPSGSETYSNLGNALREMGKTREAISCYRKALGKDSHNIEAQNNIGTIFRELGQFKEAMACYQKAMRLAPGDAVPYHNMGNLFLDQGRKEEAVKCFEKALSLDAELVEALVSMGVVLQELGKGADAENCFKRAIDICPEYSKPYCHLVRTFQNECHWEGLKQYSPVLDRFTQQALDQGRKPDEVPFLHLSRHADPEKNYRVAKAWSDHLVKHVHQEGRIGHVRPSRGNCRDDKLTVGYLSNNFKNHPTAHLVGGMFRHHRRDRYNIYCYSYGENDRSAYRQQIEGDCDRFFDLERVNHADAAQQIRQDKVDILVDLVGHMKSNRLEIPAMRPAPIQVRWLGMAGTSGADFFDYIITDESVTPRNHAQYYAETFSYMPHTYQINNRQQMVSQKDWQRKDVGLPDNGFVYCSFCSTYKIEPNIYNAWMAVLQRVPESVLWLLAPSPDAQERLRAHAHHFGIDAHRLVFAEKVDRADHLARLPLADLALDTMIVNGAATTSEALWCGVPVLTLQGTHFASRMASSILQALEMPLMIAGTLEKYTRLAVQLALDQPFYRSVISRLERSKDTSALFDTAGFVRSLEDLYDQMWRTYITDEKKRILWAKA
jgi:predicted O-linked N-acetylglucosamine transferase (SPINDLY family)